MAGHLDGNEEVVTAMIREAKEEAGITIAPSEIQIVDRPVRLHRQHGEK